MTLQKGEELLESISLLCFDVVVDVGSIEARHDIDCLMINSTLKESAQYVFQHELGDDILARAKVSSRSQGHARHSGKRGNDNTQPTSTSISIQRNEAREGNTFDSLDETHGPTYR